MIFSSQAALLAGRRILVTGAARGLGFSFARTLCESGAWLMTRVCRSALRASGRGAIVNLASDTAMWGGGPNLLAYVASKGAVIAMTHSLARELSPDNITVNAIAPGLVLVEATQYVPEARHRRCIDQRALQREQMPEDVSVAVLYVLSDFARFVTGQVLAVNGGFVMR